MTPSEQIVQAQLEAYNRKDLEAWLATYAADAAQYDMDGYLLAQGHAQMRERMVARFAEPSLHARLLHRIVMGDVVVDHEEVARDFPEGPGVQPMVCVYRVAGGKIVRGSFALGDKVLR